MLRDVRTDYRLAFKFYVLTHLSSEILKNDQTHLSSGITPT